MRLKRNVGRSVAVTKVIISVSWGLETAEKRIRTIKPIKRAFEERAGEVVHRWLESFWNLDKAVFEST